MIIRGRVIKYESNVNTDAIIPGRYLVLTDPNELAKHALEDVDPDLFRKISQGRNIIVAGENFGCGSSREHAVIALKYAGIRAIVAESFARIFYRNSINLGLPIVECRKISTTVSDGDEIEIDLTSGEIRDLSSNTTLKFSPSPTFLLEILSSGGLMNYIKRRLE